MPARRRATNGSLHEVSEAIGELRTAIEYQTKATDGLTRMIEEDRRAAATYRTDMRQDIRSLHEKVDPILLKMPSIESEIDMTRRGRLEHRGMKRIVGWLIKLAMMAGGIAGWEKAKPWIGMH